MPYAIRATNVDTNLLLLYRLLKNLEHCFFARTWRLGWLAMTYRKLPRRFRSWWSAHRSMPRRNASVSSNRVLFARNVGSTLPRHAYMTLPYARMLVAMELTNCNFTRALFSPSNLQLARTALKALRDCYSRALRMESGRVQLAVRLSPRYRNSETCFRAVAPHLMTPWQLMSITFVLVVLMVRSFSRQKRWKHDSTV
jgi:hypothetical protein